MIRPLSIHDEASIMNIQHTPRSNRGGRGEGARTTLATIKPIYPGAAEAAEAAAAPFRRSGCKKKLLLAIPPRDAKRHPSLGTLFPHIYKQAKGIPPTSPIASFVVTPFHAPSFPTLQRESRNCHLRREQHCERGRGGTEGHKFANNGPTKRVPYSVGSETL